MTDCHALAVWLPLERAALCVECEAVFDLTGLTTCPACGSEHFLSIGRLLNPTD